MSKPKHETEAERICRHLRRQIRSVNFAQVDKEDADVLVRILEDYVGHEIENLEEEG